MYVPPYSAVLRLLDHGDGNTSLGHAPLTLAVIRLLLQEVLITATFDESGYLDKNPDVFSAIRRGDIGSAHEHYISDGYFEGREGANQVLDETWYLKFYPDVAAAVRQGRWSSGRDHYYSSGIFEWRSPSENLLNDVERWRALLNESQDNTNKLTPGEHSGS